MRYYVSNTTFAIILMGKGELVALLCFFVFLLSPECCVALPRGATRVGLSAVCNCSIS